MVRPALIEIGYVSRAQGLRGGLRVRLHNEHSKILEDVDAVYLEGPGDAPKRSFSIDSVGYSGNFALLSLGGVTDRTRAESLVGAKVVLERTKLPALDEDEFYHFDLIGLKVVDENGGPLGRLEEIFSTPASDIYVVRGGEVGELMVPATAAYIGSIDLEAGTLTLLHIVDLLEA